MSVSATKDTSSLSSKGRVRYAPVDPTFSKPWRGLVDSTTGFLYFWNPETKITQYEKHVPSSPTPMSQRQDSHSPATNDSENFVGDKHREGNATSSSCFHNEGSEPNKVDDEQSKICTSRSGMDSEVGMSAENYRRHHEITVMGADAPNLYITFNSTGFTIGQCGGAQGFLTEMG